jgi:hypothetical protein
VSRYNSTPCWCNRLTAEEREALVWLAREELRERVFREVEYQHARRHRGAHVAAEEADGPQPARPRADRRSGPCLP